MPVSFKFVDVKTNEAIPLDQVDNMMCEFMGMKPDDKYNLLMDGITDVGLSVLCKSNKTVVTESSFNKWWVELTSDKRELVTEKQRQLLEEFLYKRYQFHAWR